MPILVTKIKKFPQKYFAAAEKFFPAFTKSQKKNLQVSHFARNWNSPPI